MILSRSVWIEFESPFVVPALEIVRLKLLVFALDQDLCCYCFGEMCDVVEQYNDRCLCGCDEFSVAVESSEVAMLFCVPEG